MKQREAERADVEGADYSRGERFAGAFVIVALLLLVGALAFSSQLAFLFADTFTLHAEVGTAEGLSGDAAVRFNGIEIGKVTDLSLTPERRVALTLKIHEEFHDIVRQDSIARVNRLALLGDVTIDITRGDPKLPPLEDGAAIPVEETPTLDALLARLAPVVDDITAAADHARAVVQAIDPETVRQMTEDLRVAVGDIRGLVMRINSGKGTVGRLFNDEQMAADIAAVATSLNETLQAVQARLHDMQPLLASATARTDEMEALLDETTQLVNQLGVAVESFSSAQGGALGGVLLEARSALDEAGKTLHAIRNTWPFSGKTPEAEPLEAVPPQPPAD